MVAQYKQKPESDLIFIHLLIFNLKFLLKIRMNKLGEDIIEMYKPYRNLKAKWKVTTLSKERFELQDHYQIIDTVGKGGYGVVVAAKDCGEQMAKSNESSLVAIKKIQKAFQHKIFTRRTLRQLRLLRLLKHENIIDLKTIILPKSRQDFQEVYTVSELMDTDLTQIIKGSNELSMEHCQFFLYQILRGLKYIHSANIVHRDLKPRNILVNANSDLKICDFGLARPLLQNSKSSILTDYVATRWYRAPQLILSANQYTPSVDMWSVGCIFAEMLLRRPFLPATDGRSQIELIFQYIGVPEDIQNMKHIPEESRKYIKQISQKKKQSKDFSKVFPSASPQAIDLLKRLFTFDPEKRINVFQALAHPYMSGLHMEDDEPVCDPVNPLEFQFQDYNLTTQQLKDMLYEQILLYNSKQFKQEYNQKKSKKESLMTHILKSSNASYIDPFADLDDD